MSYMKELAFEVSEHLRLCLNPVTGAMSLKLSDMNQNIFNALADAPNYNLIEDWVLESACRRELNDYSAVPQMW